jgi:hypothetical protein
LYFLELQSEVLQALNHSQGLVAVIQVPEVLDIDCIVAMTVTWSPSANLVVATNDVFNAQGEV